MSILLEHSQRYSHVAVCGAALIFQGFLKRLVIIKALCSHGNPQRNSLRVYTGAQTYLYRKVKFHTGRRRMPFENGKCKCHLLSFPTHTLTFVRLKIEGNRHNVCFYLILCFLVSARDLSRQTKNSVQSCY